MSPQVSEISMDQADHGLQARLDGFCQLLEKAEQWAGQYRRDGFAASKVRPIRREAERARRASRRRLCMGLFGPSQAGKSFLIGELGRAADKQLLISNPAGGEPISFIERINPNRKDEATAVACRLTVAPQVTPERSGTFVARVLSHGDLLKCLATGFAYECDFPELRVIDEPLEAIFREVGQGGGNGPFIEELDEAWSYVERSLPSMPYFHEMLKTHDIRGRLARVGGPLTTGQRVTLASSLWGMGSMKAIDTLYSHLHAALEKIRGAEYIELDQDAVVWRGDDAQADNGEAFTIGDARILSDLMTGERGTVNLHVAANGQLETVQLQKATASALVAELSLPIERMQRDSETDIVDRADILDFPGARAGKAGGSGLDTAALSGGSDAVANVVELFKRGKLTYLFEGYCQDREINALVLCVDSVENIECHHMRGQVQRWIETRYPRFDALGEDELDSPSLFVCLTKFDKLLDPSRGLGSEKRWESPIEKLRGFFGTGEGPQTADDRRSLAQPSRSSAQNWFIRWGRQTNRRFDNLYWVRNPIYPVSLEQLDEHHANYLRCGLVRDFVHDYEVKWDEVRPPEATGIRYLARSVVGKLRPEIRRQELQDQLHVMWGEVTEILSREYVAVESDQRASDARKDAERLLQLMHKHEMDCLFGPLVDRLCLPEQIVRRQLDEVNEGMVPVLTDQQVSGFVKRVTGDWLDHVRGCVEDGTLKRFLSDDPQALNRFVEQLASRARKRTFSEDFADSILFFFEHPLGLPRFRQPLTAICCRKWSNLVTTLGYSLEPAEEPVLPPKLTRDVPWRRHLDHWDRHMVRLYVDNVEELEEVPEGNEELGQILKQLAAVVPPTEG